MLRSEEIFAKIHSRICSGLENEINWISPENKITQYCKYKRLIYLKGIKY